MKRLLMVMMMVMAVQLLMADWQVIETEDLMAGKTNVSLYNPADVYQGALSEPGLIVLSDGNSGYLTYIYWGGYSLDRDASIIAIRFDDLDSEDFSFDLSANREGAFLPSTILVLLKASDVMVARVFSSTGTAMVAKWNVSGLKEKLSLVK